MVTQQLDQSQGAFKHSGYAKCGSKSEPILVSYTIPGQSVGMALCTNCAPKQEENN